MAPPRGKRSLEKMMPEEREPWPKHITQTLKAHRCDEHNFEIED